MNIYDCFMYFDEDLLLDLRLNVLDKFVKKFVIAESAYLHSGKKKKLNFDINKYSKFKDKIIYLVVDDLPQGLKSINLNEDLADKNKKILDNSLKRENFQRNYLINGLKECEEEDLVLLSDVDEIPNLEKFNPKKKISLFEQNVFYYKFNLKQPNFKWLGTRATKKKYLHSPQWLRNIKGKIYPLWRIDLLFSKKKYTNLEIIKDGGWHFTSVKTPEDLFFKFSNYLHHLEFEESQLDLEGIKKIIKERKIIYDHSVHQEGQKFFSSKLLEKVHNDELPDYISKNQIKFMKWLD